MLQLLKGNDWKRSGMFPRVTFCDIDITQVGQANTHTIQCVLMANVFNEKLYLMLWFWLVFLAVVNLISAVSSTLLLCCPYLHYSRVIALLRVIICIINISW
ncbi:unnamed protein product [Gongylonema pulchrum]|uniref:Innexin n=1 Tax=Gongylonema pulchrum TaxID=637853 RepID=A0A3P6R496_9BILA|nr:unnamed protein product [Gongylonema pulchrum]